MRILVDIDPPPLPIGLGAVVVAVSLLRNQNSHQLEVIEMTDPKTQIVTKVIIKGNY